MSKGPGGNKQCAEPEQLDANKTTNNQGPAKPIGKGSLYANIKVYLGTPRGRKIIGFAAAGLVLLVAITVVLVNLFPSETATPETPAILTPAEASSLRLNHQQLLLKEGEEALLTVAISDPHGLVASNKSALTWKSGNEKVATVTAEGLVTALAEGEADITAQLAHSELHALCKVIVEPTVSADEPATDEDEFAWFYDSYIGSFVDGKPHGSGTLQIEDVKLNLNWEYGKLVDYYVLDRHIVAEGDYQIIKRVHDIYIGPLKGGSPHGKGTLFTVKGSVWGSPPFYDWPGATYYFGELYDGEPHGTGEIIWPNAAYYAGEFKSGKKHGHGKFTHPDGSYYEGLFVENKIQGNWTWTPPGVNIATIYEADKPAFLYYPNIPYMPLIIGSNLWWCDTDTFNSEDYWHSGNTMFDRTWSRQDIIDVLG